MKRPHTTDNRAQFALRWLDYARANSPRQRRFKARKIIARESLNENLSAVGGVLLLAAIVIAIFFI